MRRRPPFPEPRQKLRCAIYTRVSTDAGLEQDFNSLDAQREAGEAYVKSQSHEGWSLIRERFDDGGYSGGSLERPALARLLQAVRDKRVDIIVVYKVDRLTRSLADFAKLVELFDAVGISFVSITQSFNTTTSMGRLTLNVLLSFAQFEREVTGERIRDKIAASKKKGLWMGGVVPLGYRVIERKLVIDEDEARTVRLIFERYLALGSMLPLLEELRDRGLLTRARTLASGRTVGGIPFTKGPLAHLLKNRTYLGELNHRGSSYPADHAGIVDRDVFDAVQARLAENATIYHRSRSKSEALLAGLLFDEEGGRMGPSHARKGSRVWRYYVSRSVTEGDRKRRATVTRIAAPHVEDSVLEAMRGLQLILPPVTYPKDADADVGSTAPTEDARLVALIERITVGRTTIQIALRPEARERGAPPSLSIPWSPYRPRPRRDIIVPADPSRPADAPIRSDTRATLLDALARGRAYLDDLVSKRAASPNQIAIREGRSPRSVNMMLSLAFLSPAIVVAAIESRLPRGIGVTRLVDLPGDWARQHELLGLAPVLPSRDAA
jgi:site-specific DNA recombinase